MPELIKQKGELFEQDNAKPYTSLVPRQKLSESDWYTMLHPSYFDTITLVSSGHSKILCTVKPPVQMRGSETSSVSCPQRQKKITLLLCQQLKDGKR